MFVHYLPTINLMVFVKTPFKASASDTAAKQKEEKKKKKTRDRQINNDFVT